MVLVTSRFSHFSATTLSSHRKDAHHRWRPFSRSYGSILPSSLTRDHSSALEYSSHLPVSVCGTVGWNLISRFSRKCRITDDDSGIAPIHALASLSLTSVRTSLHQDAYTLRAPMSLGNLRYLAPSLHHSNNYNRYRNINLLSIAR